MRPRTIALLFVFVVAAVLVGLLAGWGWALLAAGLELGGLGAGARRIVNAALSPLRALGVAAAPLALPLLAVLVAGAPALDAWVGLAAGAVAILVAWRWILAPGLRKPRVAPLILGRPALVAFGALLVVSLALAIVVVEVVHSGVDLGQDRGGPSAVLLAWAVMLFVATAIARMVGFARTRVRVVVAVLVLIAALRGAIAVGMLPGESLLSGGPGAVALLTLAGGVLLLACAVEVAIQRVADRVAEGVSPVEQRIFDLETPLLPAGVTSYSAGLGLIAATFAAVVIVVAALVAANQLRSQVVRAQPNAAAQLTQPGVDPAIVKDDKRLADLFAPVLFFSAAEPWSPTSVVPYLRHARISGPNARPGHPTVASLPRSCPGLNASPCYHLSIDCPDGDARCAMGGPHGDLGRSGRYATIYARVVRRSEHDGSPHPFVGVPQAPASAQLGKAAILLQYWFFYPYDQWTTPVLGGQLTQQHEGDWEAVMIGLSRTAEPLFMAFSEHCGGTWYPWDSVRLAPGTGSRTHPYVAVADGSQANYLDPKATRSPDWTGCAGIPGGLATVVSYASNIRDRTGDARSWRPDHLTLVDATTPPMSFPGTWGANDHTTLLNLLPHRISAEGEGPRTPTVQELWLHPLTTVFAGAHWHAG